MDQETTAPVDDLEARSAEDEDEALGDAITFLCTLQAGGC
jgi:hypothetical protein